MVPLLIKHPGPVGETAGVTWHAASRRPDRRDDPIASQAASGERVSHSVIVASG